MKSLLSPRLLACCSFIAPHSRVADVGCDHGYLGITLLQKGLADHIYAGDVNEGPLQSAVYNAEKYGVQDHIQFFLSDGLRNFPRDFDTLVCAGMGADTIVSILEAAPWIRDFRYTLILQCQSKTPFLRQYLSAQQWNICEETVVRGVGCCGPACGHQDAGAEGRDAPAGAGDNGPLPDHHEGRRPPRHVPRPQRGRRHHAERVDQGLPVL